MAHLARRPGALPARVALAASAAVGLVCIVLVVSWQAGPAGLLQTADGVRGRMEAMGKELELEGARAAGAKLIKEADELTGGKSKPMAKTHKLQQAGGLPPRPQDIGFNGHAPYKQGVQQT